MEEIKRWYPKNKEKQVKNILKDYYKHTKKWRIRAWVFSNKKIILPLINKKCANCGKSEIEIIGNMKFVEYPKLKSYGGIGNINKVKNYVKDGHLKGFCSKQCLVDYKKKQKVFKQKNTLKI